MKTIWKFPIGISDGQEVRMPAGAEILSVGLIDNTLNIWAMVDNMEKEVEDRLIRIHGTGHHVYKRHLLTFIGTIIQPIPNGQVPALVWHVFEERRS